VLKPACSFRHFARRPFARLTSALAAAGFLLAAAPVHAQGEYPSRPIRLIVPFPAGGGVDVSARILAPKLGAALKQNVIVENIGGAAGSLGHDAAARAQADGHTLLLASASTIVTAPLLNTVPWDPVKSYTPIAKLTIDPMPLILNPKVPANNVAELVALAKSNPKSLTMASFGVGSVPHLAGELFNILAQTKILHVPYKGGGPALNDIIGGHVSLMFNSVGPIVGPVAAGTVKLIAVGASTRNPRLPNTPTVAESGLPEFQATSWIGLYGPANLPQPIVERLSGEIVKILKDPEVQAQFAKMGISNASGTQQELRESQERDMKLWGRVVREANIKTQ
jgi:tripartite-type tricarboxylate transporter receptor subunit TctC